jgi:hypothetical protein
MEYIRLQTIMLDKITKKIGNNVRLQCDFVKKSKKTKTIDLKINVNGLSLCCAMTIVC